jgi:hypothetical protein
LELKSTGRKINMIPINKNEATITRRQIRLYDIAYGCFLYIGIAWLLMIFDYVVLSSISETLFVGFAFLLAIPVLLGIPVSILGVIFSVLIGNEWQLWLLSFLTLLVVGGGILMETWGLGDPSDWLILSYSLVTTWMSLQWFRVRRKDRIGED